MTTEIASYTNGNTQVKLYADGTKIRRYEGEPQPEFPESIDVKITNRCDLWCPYCHEQSGDGEHGDLRALLTKLEDLPAGVELAIGGGNPLMHPQLPYFLNEAKKRGLIAHITVNERHLWTYRSYLHSLVRDGRIRGIGVSIPSDGIESNSCLIGDIWTLTELKLSSAHLVYHVICGLHKVEILDEIRAFHPGARILVLGYKQFGRGEQFHCKAIDEEIVRWSRLLPAYMDKVNLSFDNLAIEQLDVKRLFTKEAWEQFYMGDDFTFSMYVDAVERVFAPTSRSSERIDWNECSLKEYFSRRNK